MGVREQTAPRASTCHVVHAEQVGELHLSREAVERLFASGSFFWIDLHLPTEEDFAAAGSERGS